MPKIFRITHFTFNQTIIEHIAELASIPVSNKEIKNLIHAFNGTLEIINSLQSLPLDNVEPTHHTTDLINVLRPDRVDKINMLTQAEALANAKHVYQGYFMVPQVIKNKKA